MKVNENMAYKPQYGPGTSKVAENRRKQMNPNQKLEKMRDVTDEDIVMILGHRALEPLSDGPPAAR